MNSDYLHFTMKKLSLSKASEFAKRWTEEINLDETQEILDSFHQWIKEEVIITLTQTPLQITILIFLIRQKGTSPPKQCEELFQIYIDKSIQREWNKLPPQIKDESALISGLHDILEIFYTRK